MPGKVKVRILAGRNLPVMDKSSDTSDAFVEVKLGNTTYKTEVFRRSLNPFWNSEWFRFEVDDEELQDEPLQIRIMDYDTYSANDAIGKVYIDLNPLLNKDSGHVMTGWFPIYDTMHGIRGEVNCVVKVDLFSDTNRFRQSSCGVRFFYAPGVPVGYSCQAILGFVEELVVNDDPEYQWIDKIRTPRASNEARQTLFSKLSGEVQRKIGLKALDLGGNCVLGYQQFFDLEGESGLIVRGIGTAVFLSKVEKEHSSSEKHGRSHSHHHAHTGIHRHSIPSPTANSFPQAEDPRQDDPVCCLQSEMYYEVFSPCPPSSSSHNVENALPRTPHSPAVAFLFPCESLSSSATPYSSYGHSHRSTPSPPTTLRRTSPTPFATNAISPRLQSWINKFTKSVSSPNAPRKFYSQAAPIGQNVTLPRSSTPTKIGLSLDAETFSLNVKSSPGFGESLIQRSNSFLAHRGLKRVNSQPLAVNRQLSQQQQQHSCPSSGSGSNLPRFEPIPASPVRSEVPLAAAQSDETLRSPSLSIASSSKTFISIPRVPGTASISNLDIEGAKESNGHSDNSMCVSCSPTDLVMPPLVVIPPGTLAPLTVPISAKLTSGSPLKNFHLRRGSSDPDLSITPKIGSSHSSVGSSHGIANNYKFNIAPESLHLLEYPFITMKQFPIGLIQHVGGVVSSRSVKLLDQINNPEEPETRDAWWTELRKEIRSHCRALGCNAVLGYCENTHICDEVVILSASGTAVTLHIGPEKEPLPVIPDKEERDSDPGATPIGISTSKSKGEARQMPSGVHSSESNSGGNQPHSNGQVPSSCSLCHIPYQDMTVPFPMSLIKCGTCKKARVPDILFMTIEPPPNLPITGIGCLIQARVCRSKRDSKGEYCAKEISDSLPFLEYELHRQLLSKLKVKGMNALFELTVQISVGENMLVAIATGTGAFISCLPSPLPPKISSGKGVKTSKLNEIQKLIQESIHRNREHYGLAHVNALQTTDLPNIGDKDAELSDSSPQCVKELFTSNNRTMNGNNLEMNEDTQRRKSNECDFEYKESCLLLEVDDTEDADIISLMIDSDVPKGYEICNTETMPGLSAQLVCNLQTFTQVYRAKLTTPKQFGQQFDWIIQSIFVKLRRLIPCCLTGIKFRVDLPEQDLVLVTVLGSAIGIGSPKLCSFFNGQQPRPRKRTASLNSDGYEELMFTMDDEHHKGHSEAPVAAVHSEAKRDKAVPYHLPSTEHYGIELTPLSFIPGSNISHYLGNLDFFFIRESTSIRESGGLNGFMHSFLTEVLAIVRAHVSGLGGNAMTSLHLTQCVLLYNPHKNQAQCLINVAGDAVIINYNLVSGKSANLSDNNFLIREPKEE